VINNKADLKNSTNNDDSQYGIDIDVYKTTKLLLNEIRIHKDFLIVGHLAPYVLKKTSIDLVIVLRRSPYELEKILEQRRYSPLKIKENIACEVLGISFYDSLKTFGKGKVAELDCSGKPCNRTADEIVNLLKNKRKQQRVFATVDWLSLVYEKGDVGRFLEY
jgi:adenylate kinase